MVRILGDASEINLYHNQDAKVSGRKQIVGESIFDGYFKWRRRSPCSEQSMNRTGAESQVWRRNGVQRYKPQGERWTLKSTNFKTGRRNPAQLLLIRVVLQRQETA